MLSSGGVRGISYASLSFLNERSLHSCRVRPREERDQVDASHLRLRPLSSLCTSVLSSQLEFESCNENACLDEVRDWS